MVVFSTNLEPRDLADEAFLRRIHNKIFIEPVSSEVFDKIFDRLTAEKGMPTEPGSAELLRELCRNSGALELRACYPRDILSIIEWIKDFEGEPAEVTGLDLERAVELYFTRNEEAQRQSSPAESASPQRIGG
jgi:hypothetical protein